ncbi:MAG: DALR domain-containing protein, partial [Acidobacteriota bacterium]
GQGSIYYRIAKFPEYGKLARLRPEELRSTGRAESDEYDKQDVRDFALWKKTKEGEPSWKTEIGVGRPGWHLECSAMSMHYLGESFDLHTGGVDNIFPHHENEIAQSEAATGKPFVRSWLHCAHLMVNGEKMSKSLGNFFTLRDLLDRQQDPMAIRYLLLSQHYRKPLNFTLEGIRWAAGNLVRLEDFRRRISSEPAEPGSQSALSAAIRQAGEKFHAALDDDLNNSAALAAVFDLIRVANTACDQGGLREDDRRGILDLMKAVEDIFGIPLARTEPEAEAEILSLIEERSRARKAGDFRRADEIRDTLAERGIVLEDTPGGVRWKRPR